MRTYYLAIDIGASGGRHVLGHIQDGRLLLEEVYRFANQMCERNDHLCWDVDLLFSHILAGMKACRQRGKIPKTMGIDTWAVDFALLDAAGARLGDVVAYRDKRTHGLPDSLEDVLPFRDLYEATGIQKQPFNTIYQLLALQKKDPDLLLRADSLLLLPDYFHYLLTGVKAQEYTNASSTALVDAATQQWHSGILQKLALPQGLFQPLSPPGTHIGPLTQAMQQAVGFPCTVVLPATHDTGSAFLAVPAREKSVFLSSGTWSLLGVERTTPLTSDAARKANFSNEGGYGGRYRFLKNIMGLWMIQSIRREQAERYSYAELEEMARAEVSFCSVVDVNAQEFLAPASMTQAVKQQCGATQQQAPQTLGQLVKCVYASLAQGYAAAARELQEITGEGYDNLCIVGGGSKDGYLNQLTADATGMSVYAGPVEGTVIGNLIAQLLADGQLDSVAHAREVVRESFPIREYRPS